MIVRHAGIATASWREPPLVVVIGAKRAGSTFLFRVLEQHPGFVPLLPSARWPMVRSNMKGPKYFNREYERGSRWYLSHFPTRWRIRYRSRRAGTRAFTCDVGSGYLHDPAALGRLCGDLPESHVIAVLRDPVDRAHSHWRLNRFDGVEPIDDFALALEAESERVEAARALRQTDPARSAWLHETFSYVGHGNYGPDVSRLFLAATPERAHVIFAEELFGSTETMVNEMLNGIGLAAFDTVPRLPAQNATIPEPLDPQLVARIRNGTRESDLLLEGLLGRSLPWRRYQ